MDFPILCEHLLHSDLDQADKIQRITFLLDRVYDVLGSDATVSQAVPFNVTPKGEKQARQYQAILQYKGPDIETRLTLEQYHKEWLEHPQQFWEPVDNIAFGGLSPEAQIVSRYTYGEIFDDRCKTVKKMINLGSYYRSLEQALGKGVTLALGIDLAEDTWTRIMTKTTPKFEIGIKHLRTTQLAQLAQTYAQLREKLVHFERERLWDSTAIFPTMSDHAMVVDDTQHAEFEGLDDDECDAMLQFCNYGLTSVAQPWTLQMINSMGDVSLCFS